MIGLAAAIVVVAVGGALLLTPQTCFVHGSQLLVRTRTITFHFDLGRADGAEPVSREKFNRWKTLRLFGVGWPLQPFGWFHNATLGTFLSLVNDPARMWMVQFPGRKLLVSPADDAALRAMQRGSTR